MMVVPPISLSSVFVLALCCSFVLAHVDTVDVEPLEVLPTCNTLAATFTALASTITATPGGCARLTAGATYSAIQTINLYSGANFTIVGDLTSPPVIQCSPIASIVMFNMNGGALTLLGVKIQSCTTDVINAVGATVTIQNSRFISNSHRVINMLPSSPSAYDSVMNMYNVSFNSNNDTATSNVVIKNAVVNMGRVLFDQNQAKYSILHLEGCTTTAHILVFTKNQGDALLSDGSLYVEKGFLNLRDSRFIENSALSAAAILFTNTGADLENITVTGNTGTNYGSIAIFYAEINIRGSSFEQNSAGSGGAISLNIGAKITVSNNTVIRNNTANIGGAIYLEHGSISLIGTTVSYNTAALGGAFYADSGSIAFTDSTVSYNSVSSIGGAGLVFNDGQINTTNTIIQGNSASFQQGSALYVNGASAQVLIDTTKIIQHNDSAIVLLSGYISISNSSVEYNGNPVSTFGGAFFIPAGTTTLVVSNTSLSYNSAKFGGALYLEQTSDIQISNSTIGHNTATQGAGMYVQSATATFTETVIEHNYATEFGSGIFSGNSPVIFVNCNLRHNSGGPTMNGSIAIVYGSGTFNFTACNFSDNVAGIDYGIRVSDSVQLVVTDSVFTDNKALSGGGAVLGAGGTSTVSFKNTQFLSNGAKFGGSLSLMDNTAVVVLTSFFKENSADLGGAVFIEDNAVLTVDSSTATSNVANDGAAFYLFGDCSLLVKNSNITNNEAATTAGAIRVGGANVTVQGSLISGNSAGDGGAFYAHAAAVLVVSDSQVRNNSATFGGAFNVYNSTSTTVTNSSIDSNKGEKGAAFYVFNAATTVTINGGSISNNKAYDTGAAFTVFQGATVNVADCTLASNVATNEGGALSVYGASKATVVRSTLSGNNAFYGGAVNSFGQSTVTIKDSFITSNTASYGGAMYIYQGTILNLSNTTVSGNAVNDSAGAIRLFNPSTIAYVTANSIFSNNIALYGAAFDVFAGAEVNITDSEVSFNKATFGAGFHVYNSGKATVNNTLIKNNSASSGAGFYVFGAAVTLTHSVVSNNDVDGSGGAGFYIFNRSNVSVGSTVFTNNIGPNGVAFYMFNSTLDVATSDLNHNNATEYGGAILYSFKGGNSTFQNSQVNNNRAPSGGAFYVFDQISSLVVRQSTVNNNTALQGGGAFLFFNTTVEVRDCQVSGNNGGSASSGGGGGAIYFFSKSRATISNTDISNNNGYNGGGIYCFDTIALITNCTIKNNTAGYGGGVLAGWYSNMTVTNCTVTGNIATMSGDGLLFQPSNTQTVFIKNSTISNSNSDIKLCCGGSEVTSAKSQLCNYPTCSNCAGVADGCSCPELGVCSSCTGNFTGAFCSQAILKCPGTPECSGNGTCVEGVCVCNSTFIGPACDQIIPVASIALPNKTSSVATYSANARVAVNSTVFNNTGAFDIGVREIREVSGAATVKTFLTNSSIKFAAPVVRKTANYTETVISGSFGNGAFLNVSMMLFTTNQSTVMQFANSTFTLDPYSLKYSFTISNYTFDAPQNHLQLYIQSTSNYKNGTAAVTRNSQTNLLYFTIDSGASKLYSRMIPNVLLDDEIKGVISSFAADTGDIMLDIPRFLTSVVVDPNFAILLGSDAGGNGGSSSTTAGSDVDGGGDHDGVSNKVIIAVVVSVVGAAILGAVIAKVVVPKIKRHHAVSKGAVQLEHTPSS